MRVRQNEQQSNTISGFQAYLYANAAIFIGALYLFSPSRIPSSFDYDYPRYMSGSEPYGNSAFIGALNVTVLINILGLAVYSVLSACCSAPTTVANNQATLFAKIKTEQNNEENQPTNRHAPNA